MEANAKPSHGSVICTYADCRFRKEEYQDVLWEITGRSSTDPGLCDWSECHFDPNDVLSCESTLASETCPCGFRM
jgi:hypothetical protein